MKNENMEKVKPNLGKKAGQAEADTGKVSDADATCIEPEVGMTIAVEIQRRDEHFTILDLKMHHQECEGGLIEIHERNGYHFRCKRCDISRDIAGSDVNKEGVINAALEGVRFRTLSTRLDTVVFMQI